MKICLIVFVFGIVVIFIGCQNMDFNGLFSLGVEVFQVYFFSDVQVKILSDQVCKEMDVKVKIVLVNSEYSQWLNKIVVVLGDNINGQFVNYKVYEIKDVNVFVMVNGCICVYSGLMDLMNDNEVEVVIGYEMGYVVLGYVKKGMQVVLGINVVCVVVVFVGGIVGSLLQFQLGDLGEKLVNLQFFQCQELEVDDYFYDLLCKCGINLLGLVISFEKLVKLEVGCQSFMFDDYLVLEVCVQYICDCMKVDGIK